MHLPLPQKRCDPRELSSKKRNVIPIDWSYGAGLGFSVPLSEPGRVGDTDFGGLDFIRASVARGNPRSRLTEICRLNLVTPNEN